MLARLRIFSSYSNPLSSLSQQPPSTDICICVSTMDCPLDTSQKLFVMTIVKGIIGLPNKPGVFIHFDVAVQTLIPYIWYALYMFRMVFNSWALNPFKASQFTGRTH